MRGAQWAWRLAVVTLLQCVATAVVPDSLCLAVLSYNRIELLEHTLDAVTTHLRTDEPGLSWGVAWVDNGSDAARRPAMEALRTKLLADPTHPLETRWYKENQGMAAAFNTLYFNLCANYEFVLTLEEDWLYNRQPGSGRIDRLRVVERLPEEDTGVRQAYLSMQHMAPTAAATRALATSMALLRRDPRLLGVSLRGETQLKKYPPWETARVALPLPAATQAGDLQCADDAAAAEELEVTWRQRCMSEENEHYWGSYSNGGCLYSLERLATVGRFFGHVNNTAATTVDEVSMATFPDVLSEPNFAYRAGLHFCLAELLLDEGCPGPSHCNHVLTHIGGGKRSTKEQTDSTTHKNAAYIALRENFPVRMNYLVLDARAPTRDVQPMSTWRLLPPSSAAAALQVVVAHETSLLAKYLPMRHTLEDGLARVLDALETECIEPQQPSPGASSTLASADADGADTAPLPAPLQSAIDDLQQRLAVHYQNMSFAKPSMPSTWHMQKYLATLHAKRGGSSDEVPVRVMDGHMQLQRLAAELPRVLFLADSLATCPSPRRHGVLFTHFLAHSPGKLNEGDENTLEYMQRLQRLASWVAQLPPPSQLGEQGTQVVIIHRGVQADVLARLTELRPDLQLLAVEELGLAATQVADAVWLRYQTALAAINQLQLKSPWLDSFAMVDFMEFAVARDPLALMAVLAPTFDLFVAAYLEPMLYLTHSRVQSCFPSGVELPATGTGYSAAFVGGPAPHMKQFLAHFLSVALTMPGGSGSTSQTCEDIVLAALLWDHAMVRGGFVFDSGSRAPALPPPPLHVNSNNPFEIPVGLRPWRVFSAAPLTAGLKWWDMTASRVEGSLDTRAFYLRFW